jgi:Flp pilus assembly CpaF family ATPase
VTLLHHSVASNKYHKAFFRQIATQVRRVSDYTSNPDAIHLLQQLVQQKENLLIAGSTGSGKTSLLSTLLQLSHPAEHLVILEDTLEIQAPHERLTRLIAKSHSGHSLTEYLTHALRLSPDRLVLGEMRSKEVIAYLLAMNTGHRGMLSTLHASSAVDATLRVAQLFCLASGAQEINYTEVLRLVTRNVGHVVFVENRQIKEIIRIYGCDETQPLYDRIF